MNEVDNALNKLLFVLTNLKASCCKVAEEVNKLSGELLLLQDDMKKVREKDILGAKEIIVKDEQLKDRISKRYYCPNCNSILPKALYAQAYKPSNCCWCGQKLLYRKGNNNEPSKFNWTND